MRPHEAPQSTLRGPMLQDRGEVAGGAGLHQAAAACLADATRAFSLGRMVI